MTKYSVYDIRSRTNFLHSIMQGYHMRMSNVFFVFAILYVLFSSSFASKNIINENKVRNVADNFLIYKSAQQYQSAGKPVLYKIESIDRLEDPITNKNLAYIVSVQPQGFLIISSNGNLEQIIAYSFKQDWICDDNTDNVIFSLLRKYVNEKKER